MSNDVKIRLIDATVAVMRENSEQLTALDQAIGDGDHGINMKRGFEAIAAERDVLADLAWPQALHKAGMALVMKVGGASGPLYGSLLMQMGKAAGEELITIGDVANCLGAGVEAVKQRGKSTTGEKTMLDVLVPVQQALQQAAGNGADSAAAIAAARRAADQGHAAAKEMVATKGRASYLGERSKGHDDPGATSSRLLVHTVCDVLEGAR